MGANADELDGFTVTMVGLPLLTLGIGLVIAAPRLAKVLGREFAIRNLAYVDVEFVAQYDRETTRQIRRTVALALPLLLAILLTIDGGTGPKMMVFAAVAVLFTIESGLRLHRAGREFTPTPGRPVLARPRSVGITDYLSRTALCCYVSQALTASLLLAAVLSSIDQGGTGALISALILTLVAMLNPLQFHILVNRPQQAVDAAHLYFQDAWRADELRTMAMWLAIPTWLCAEEYVSTTDLSPVLAGALLVSGVVTIFSFFWDALQVLAGHLWFRKRLWPMLAPRQVLLPGDPIPTAGQQ
ncbi:MULTISPECIES: hypothetical protein [Nocardioides]|uniref:DUF4013 domain-containing protein n=1 Tax=Nocardioides vastitatis TaxID=2568655 RepID=A0ABW0ZNK8_9ACTN|nr:hypothetical protein [Nocardioides sp.]THI96162.1 hypothetical protein E7Z54_17385 [Nocardioides sp.]